MKGRVLSKDQNEERKDKESNLRKWINRRKLYTAG